MPPLKPILLLVSALFLSACNQATGGVPGTIWQKSTLSIDASSYDNRLPCEGGVTYDLTSTDLHLTGRVVFGAVYGTPEGIFRRGAAYTLEVSCLDRDLHEAAHTSLSATVPVNGHLNWFGHEPEEDDYQVGVMLRQDLSKPQVYTPKCLGTSQGSGAPCITVND